MKNFRIAGIGGQSVVTLATKIAEAAIDAGIKVSVIDRPRSAMRLEPITCDVIFNQEHMSAFIACGDADTVIGLMNAQKYVKTGGRVILNKSIIPSITQIAAGEGDEQIRELEAELIKYGLCAGYYLLGVLCKNDFPVPVENIKNVLSSDKLQAFENRVTA